MDKQKKIQALVNEPPALDVSAPVYTHSGSSTLGLMLDLLIALLPAAAYAVMLHGSRAATIMGISCLSAVISELIFGLILRRRLVIGDLSALASGLILALTLPEGVPYWVPALGAFVAVALLKQAFGGIGKNIFNPAFAARALLPFICGELEAFSVDMTELSLGDMLLGRRTGGMGEIGVLLIILGGIYLAMRGVIKLRYPLLMLGTVGILAIIFAQSADTMRYAAYELLGGGLIFASVFAISDPVTSPVTAKGKLVHAVCAGALTFLLRRLGMPGGGVYLAVVISGALSRPIDMLTRPRVFGR